MKQPTVSKGDDASGSEQSNERDCARVTHRNFMPRLIGHPGPPANYACHNKEDLESDVGVKPRGKEHDSKECRGDNARPPCVNTVSAGEEDREGIEDIRRNLPAAIHGCDPDKLDVY